MSVLESYVLSSVAYLSRKSSDRGGLKHLQQQRYKKVNITVIFLNIYVKFWQCWPDHIGPFVV